MWSLQELYCTDDDDDNDDDSNGDGDGADADNDNNNKGQNNLAIGGITVVVLSRYHGESDNKCLYNMYSINYSLKYLCEFHKP